MRDAPHSDFLTNPGNLAAPPPIPPSSGRLSFWFSERGPDARRLGSRARARGLVDRSVYTCASDPFYKRGPRVG